MRPAAETLSLFRKVYYQLHEVDVLFPHWSKVSRRLSQTLLEKNECGQVTLAALGTTATQTLALDIDDHLQRGNDFLAHLYDSVLRCFGHPPSLLFRSPRGLHAYFLFVDWRPNLFNKADAKEKLSRTLGPLSRNIEVKLTAKEPLRLPRNADRLDPLTCEPMEGANAPERYLYEQILGEQSERGYLLNDLENRKARLRNLGRKGLKLESIIAASIPFENHATNEPYKRIVGACYYAGLTEKETLERFRDILRHSPGYTGPLAGQLPSRIRSSFRSFKKNGPWTLAEEQRKPWQPGLYDEQLISQIQKSFGRRPKAVRKIVETLLYWKQLQDAISESPEQLSAWNHLYTFHRKNRRAGFYPIPRNLLYKQTHAYKQIIDHLEELGILEAAPFGYSTSLQVCKHFRINFDRFQFGEQEQTPLQLLKNAAARFTQKELADFLEISQPSVFRYLDGKRKIPDALKLKIKVLRSDLLQQRDGGRPPILPPL